MVQCIKELRDHGIALSEIAVLFRAGFHSFDLEGELTRNRISFVKYGGFKFLESLHIKDVLAHLKVVNNPKDRLSWIRILRLLPGVGMKTAMKLASELVETGFLKDPSSLVPKDKKYRESFFKVVRIAPEFEESKRSDFGESGAGQLVLLSIPSGAL